MENKNGIKKYKRAIKVCVYERIALQKLHFSEYLEAQINERIFWNYLTLININKKNSEYR